MSPIHWADQDRRDLDPDEPATDASVNAAMPATPQPAPGLPAALARASIQKAVDARRDLDAARAAASEVMRLVPLGRHASPQECDQIRSALRAIVTGAGAEGGGPPPAPAAPEQPREGWSRIIPPHRKSHYFVSGRSLCGRYGFPPEPLNADDYTSPDDCAACRKKLTLRKLDAAALAKSREPRP